MPTACGMMDIWIEMGLSAVAACKPSSICCNNDGPNLLDLVDRVIKNRRKSR
jgi:hypothetical protein